MPPSRWAWAAIAATAGFVAISCWWLSQDRGVPVYDAGTHLFTATAHYELLRAGDLAGLRTSSGFYPPTTFLVGALGLFVGGLNRWSPVLAQNLVYVPLLALGCFGTGRLVGGARAGCLAVVFALGAPLLIEQFHVFMIDAPLAALVAVSVWLILETRRFERVGRSAVAGLAVGIGLESKEQFPLFVAGLLAVLLLRERGWRNWRGLALFAAVAFVVACPWYLANLSELGYYASAGLASESLTPSSRPALLSWANLAWYLWATLNSLLFAPLFALAAIGTTDTAIRGLGGRLRRRPTAPLRGWAPELLGGLLGSWLALSLTPHHDLRYALPLIVYLAVLGTTWIVALRPIGRRLATAALCAAVIATTAGASFGAGSELRIVLPGGPVATDRIHGVPPPRQITLYSDHDFLVSAPRRGADVGALFAALRREGVTGVFWDRSAVIGDPIFDGQGLAALARLARLATPHVVADWNPSDPHHAFLARQPPGFPNACIELADGSGIVVVLGDQTARSPQFICPRH